MHAVRDGVLVRTCEALTFQHAADGAETLLQAGAAYERLARTAEEMAAEGGRLVSAAPADPALCPLLFSAGVQDLPERAHRLTELLQRDCPDRARR